MKGTQIEVYLLENGEFQCTLPPEACSDDDKIREFIDVLKGMSQDKARVWGTRLNMQETFTRYPLLRQETDLHKELDEFLTALGVNAGARGKHGSASNAKYDVHHRVLIGAKRITLCPISFCLH